MQLIQFINTWPMDLVKCQNSLRVMKIWTLNRYINKSTIRYIFIINFFNIIDVDILSHIRSNLVNFNI